MKKLTFIFALSFTLLSAGAHAQNAPNAPSGFQVEQLDGDFEMGAFKEMKGVQVLEIKDNRARKQLPNPELVYQLVKANLSYDVIKDWDQLDYDQFYIRLNSIKAADLSRIYEGVSVKQIEALKRDFKKYE